METKNLFIRETNFEDCRIFAEWERQPEVTMYFTMDEDHDYEEVVRQFVISELNKTEIQLTIVLKETEQPIGRIYISRVDARDNSCDITRIYIADSNLRGKGYGEESLRVVLDYCFINLHMERVTLDHFPGNKPAAALYQKLGFQYEGTARNAAKKNGKYFDLQLMSMLRGEYYEKVHTK